MSYRYMIEARSMRPNADTSTAGRNLSHHSAKIRWTKHTPGATTSENGAETNVLAAIINVLARVMVPRVAELKFNPFDVGNGFLGVVFQNDYTALC